MVGFIPEQEIELYEDFLSLFDEHIIVCISAFSKIEYLIKQLFSDSQLLNDKNAYNVAIYSIVKAINVYTPKEVIHSVYNKDVFWFTKEIRNFLKEQISRDLKNPKLKIREIEMFEALRKLLKDLKISSLKTIDWTYSVSFVLFKKMLDNKNIGDYRHYIDREGEQSNTLKSAQSIKLTNVEEINSKECVGVRVADMLVGLTSKIMKSLHLSLLPDKNSIIPEKKYWIKIGLF